jgi:large subunit ribosomal protein L1
MRDSKRYKESASKVDAKKNHTIDEAVSVVKGMATAKFVESMDVAVRLGVDPKKADQAVRGTVSLPHGIGKEVRVLVLTKPPRDEEAKAAGADHAGLADYIQQIQGGWSDVDVSCQGGPGGEGREDRVPGRQSRNRACQRGEGGF